MKNKYCGLYGTAILLLTSIILSYTGFWYLQLIPALVIGYFLINTLKVIFGASIISVLGLYIALLPSYYTRLKGVYLSAEISGISSYLLIGLTFIIMFIITIGGLLVGSSFNRNTDNS